MQRSLHLLAIALAALFASTADASPTADKMAAVQYLVGTWKCHHTVGTFSGEYTTTYASVLGNRWLKQTYEFPADDKQSAKQAECYIGYAGRNAWVRFFAMSTGEYFANRMSETSDGWSWKYISFFKTEKPESPEVDATFTKKSEREYELDGPSYPENGTIVREHHVCKKQ
jgi:H+/gluconate symporter-like permease